MCSRLVKGRLLFFNANYTNYTNDANECLRLAVCGIQFAFGNFPLVLSRSRSRSLKTSGGENPAAMLTLNLKKSDDEQMYHRLQRIKWEKDQFRMFFFLNRGRAGWLAVCSFQFAVCGFFFLPPPLLFGNAKPAKNRKARKAIQGRKHSTPLPLSLPLPLPLQLPILVQHSHFLNEFVRR